MDRKEKNKGKSKKKGSLLKTFIIFLVFEIVFTGITILPYGMYGPFKNFRNNVITILMGTGKHQYIAKMFFSDKKISEIVKEQSKPQKTSGNTAVTKMDVKEDKVTGIERVDFDGTGGTYSHAYAYIINDPTRVKVGVSKQIGYVGQTTREMSKEYNGILAINGGHFQDPQGNGPGAVPNYGVISDGQIKYEDSEHPIWYDMVTIDKNGKLSVGQSGTPNDFISRGVVQAVAGAPYVIENGKRNIEKGTNLEGPQPRTVIGQDDKNRIIFLVIDGRQGLALGATAQDVQNIMLKLGAVNAVCLDGGGSSTMYYNGELINNPSSSTGERAIPDMLYIEP
ncbi:phosphodiester glycosidase family protein [Clostridium hydrogenum]|uniref:phosphodiester glycosidase family protein n=1 Tax=Clostridium hydrogenum TaxID=2855764 RepID=UPI001F2974AC|nr:phosphodiester glycosidase family protein [Clostridium hydrogenum]